MQRHLKGDRFVWRGGGIIIRGRRNAPKLCYQVGRRQGRRFAIVVGSVVVVVVVVADQRDDLCTEHDSVADGDDVDFVAIVVAGADAGAGAGAATTVAVGAGAVGVVDLEHGVGKASEPRRRTGSGAHESSLIQVSVVVRYRQFVFRLQGVEDAAETGGGRSVPDEVSYGLEHLQFAFEPFVFELERFCNFEEGAAGVERFVVDVACIGWSVDAMLHSGTRLNFDARELSGSPGLKDALSRHHHHRRRRH